MANKREVAWRIFAEEFNGSKLEIRGEGEYTPSYVVTPLGAMVNRVFVVGVLTDVENIGQSEEPLYRGRVVDPTGTFYVSAGQYQPEAAKKIAGLKTPVIVAVVGKVRTYSPEAGTVYVSLRPEDITEVSPEIRDWWIVETAKLTRMRVDGMTEAQEGDKPTEEGLVKLGYSAQTTMRASPTRRCARSWTTRPPNGWRACAARAPSRRPRARRRTCPLSRGSSSPFRPEALRPSRSW
jgi:RPA family protein